MAWRKTADDGWACQAYAALPARRPRVCVPHADILLEEISYPLLAKVTERFADDDTPQERIAAIDDQVLFKVKVQRWRAPYG